MINTTIAHYKVTDKLGQGGMGEVYRATDTKLDREVAIKVLPESFAQDKERLARFEREAKVLASLDHPNIGAILGVEDADGKRCLILQLIEGETLTERLRTGAMPIDEALDVCKQIAEALEAAHEKGIIHRDLKPGNIKITPDGKVKVLDFGLAKSAIVDSSVAPSDNSQSPTLTADYTRPGMILGTAAYMSPEQARAKPVDKRSDIWSFGCVLYECLSGKCLFRGEDVTETLATVIKGEPQWTDLPSETPPHIQWLIRKCLVKDRKQRLHDISDARVDLVKAITDPNWGVEAGKQFSGVSKGGNRNSVLVAVSVVTALITLALGWFLKPDPSSPATRQVPLVLRGTNMVFSILSHPFALSSDGQKFVYAMSGTESPLRLRSFKDGTDKELQGTDGGNVPFFSPNGESVGFGAHGELRIVSLPDGPAKVLVNDDVAGASWGRSNRIVYGSSFGTGGLRIIGSDGENLEQLIEPEEVGTVHRWPQWLPDGKHVLFMSSENPNLEGSYKAEIVNVDTGAREVLMKSCHYARYAASGHLLYIKNGELYAVGFNLENFELTGQTKRVQSNVAVSEPEAGNYALSDEGTLVYLTGADRSGRSSKKLVWIDMQGNILDASNRKMNFESFDLSPDDKKVTFDVGDSIQIIDLDTDNVTRFSHVGTTNSRPIWTPDGKSIVFSSNRGGNYGIWKKNTDFLEEAKLVSPEVDHEIFPYSFSSDGETLFGGVWRRETRYDLWEHKMGNSSGGPSFVFETDAVEGFLMLSPNGEWLVYLSNGMLYVKRYDGKGVPRPITTEQVRSTRPRWSKKGDRIFYESEGGIWSILMVFKGESVEPGKREHVVQLPRFHTLRQWDIDSEEERFLVLVTGFLESEDTQQSFGPTTVNIVFNWFTELNKLLPVDHN